MEKSQGSADPPPATGPPPQVNYNAPPPVYNQPPPPQGYTGQPAPPPGYAVQPGYPPPQAGYSGQQATVVIQTQGVTPHNISDMPVTMQCPGCSANIVTRTEYSNGTMVWIVVGVMCLLGLFWGCCLIPLCINSLKDVDHYCPNCNRHLGRKERLH